MKAAVLGESGVELRDVPKPAPAPNEVLVRVHASSLNRADLLIASGHQHGKIGGVGARLGLECAGRMEETLTRFCCSMSASRSAYSKAESRWR